MDQLLTGFYDFKKTMESRFDSLEIKFDNLETRVDNLESEMNKRFDYLDKQYKSFMKDLGTTRRMAGENMRDVEDLDERVENLEAS